MQLAYVFVHSPEPDVDRHAYLIRLRAFHSALAAAPSVGFVDSWVWQSGSVDGMLEDWYLVEDWPALGALNAAAVSGSRQEPHDAVAPLAGSGAGAIYGLAHGRPVGEGHCYRVRVSKPSGVSYDTFEGALLDFAGSGAAVWKRQMVLGPDHEFLIDTPTHPSGELMGRQPEFTELLLLQ